MATDARKKKTTVKTKKKTSAVTKTRSKAAGSPMKKGAKYQCTVCGMAVTVDKICGCVEAHDIVCCGTEMKPKKK